MSRNVSPDLAKLYEQLDAKRDFSDSSSSSSSSAISPQRDSFLCKLKQDVAQIRSSYWRIDDSQHADCLAKLSCLSVDRNLVAVGSTSNYNNLKIYDIDRNSTLLTHRTSITLPDIHAVQWLYDPNNEVADANFEDDTIRFLLTGHSNGIANLTMVPLGADSGIENAQIIKRFNHEKHLGNSADGFRIANNGKPTNTLYKLAVTPRSWHSCNKNSMLSLYKENVFLWDTSRSRYPVLKSKVRGVSSFDASSTNDGLLALSGTFGVSLFDMRNSVSGLTTSFFIPDKTNTECVAVEWCKEDSNYLCSADINDRLTIWDVRKLRPMATMECHSDFITDIKWNKYDSLYSSSCDGSVVYWDLSVLNKDSDDVIKCTLRNGFNTDVSYNEIGTSIPVSNNSVVAMHSVGEDQTLTMDASFLGLHKQVKPEEKSNDSTDTLVEANRLTRKTSPQTSFLSEFERRVEEPLSFVPPPAKKNLAATHFSSSSETLLPPNTKMVNNMIYI